MTQIYFKVLMSLKLEEGTLNDNPAHLFQVELADGSTGWVAGPDGVGVCAITEALRQGPPHKTPLEAIVVGLGLAAIT